MSAMLSSSFLLPWRPMRSGSTPLGRAVLGAGITLLALSALTQARWLLLLSCLMVGARISSWLTQSRALSEAGFCFQGPKRCAVGQVAEHRVHVHNWSSRPLGDLKLRVQSAGFPDYTLSVRPTSPGGEARLSFPRLALQRGVATEHELFVTTTDWLGLRWMSAQVVVHRELIVHPAVRPMAAPSSRRRGDDMEGVSIDRSGSSLFAVREWRAGDSTRHMHWRSTARRGQNMVAELTVPSDFGLALLVTGDGRTQVTEEWVSHLASTCINALRSGRAVSVTGGPATRRMVTYGTAVDILDWFAAASVPDLLPVSSLPDCFRRVGVGGEVLVATIGEIYPNWQPAADELARQYGVAWSFLRAPGAMSGAVS